MNYIKSSELMAFIHKTQGVVNTRETQKKIYTTYMNYIANIKEGETYQLSKVVDRVMEDHPELKDNRVLVTLVIKGIIDFIERSEVEIDEKGRNIFTIKEGDRDGE